MSLGPDLHQPEPLSGRHGPGNRPMLPARPEIWTGTWKKLVLSTVHSSKGLEWKAVFIIWAVEGRFPPFYVEGRHRGIGRGTPPDVRGRPPGPRIISTFSVPWNRTSTAGCTALRPNLPGSWPICPTTWWPSGDKDRMATTRKSHGHGDHAPSQHRRPENFNVGQRGQSRGLRSGPGDSFSWAAKKIRVNFDHFGPKNPEHRNTPA